eukprot:Clim_evm21s168 gene=Clim_evmTU21s168
MDSLICAGYGVLLGVITIDLMYDIGPDTTPDPLRDVHMYYSHNTLLETKGPGQLRAMVPTCIAVAFAGVLFKLFSKGFRPTDVATVACGVPTLYLFFTELTPARLNIARMEYNEENLSALRHEVDRIGFGHTIAFFSVLVSVVLQALGSVSQGGTAKEKTK